jgi:hypothetical protein
MKQQAGGRSSIDEEIEKAINAVALTKFRTEQLHDNWRRHLFRMSVGKLRNKKDNRF